MDVDTADPCNSGLPCVRIYHAEQLGYPGRPISNMACLGPDYSLRRSPWNLDLAL